ncbi:MAG: hypothetical protein ACREWJ_12855 [Rhodoferax sp.]
MIKLPFIAGVIGWFLIQMMEFIDYCGDKYLKDEMKSFLMITATLTVAGCSMVTPPQGAGTGNMEGGGVGVDDMALKIANETCQSIGKHTKTIEQEERYPDHGSKTVVLSFSCI